MIGSQPVWLSTGVALNLCGSCMRQIGMGRIDIDAARERIVQLEEEDGVLRSEMVQLRDRIDVSENGIGLIRKQLAQADM